ncbi:hypothetical protein QBC35DRAFT_384697 [Podospora australis]|uniref:Fungal N-terminal domain-containing protein n=1 Tax=Podospora australis TaxID=1536484 RepID=A0AAN6WSW2_9PEZI|nr:hypothetical protein QBC35DRAFT_384697 [Podospora australis]
MADPLSAGGLAVGLIASGIQVGGGLVDYLNAVKGQPEDIASARRLLDNMTDTLQVLKSSATRFQAVHSTSTAAVERRLAAVRVELQALETTVREFESHGQPSSSLHGRVKAQGRKLFYPFERTKLGQLEQRLEQTNNVLDKAIHALQLYRYSC